MSERPQFKRPRSRIITEDARIRVIFGEKLRENFTLTDDTRPARMYELLDVLNAREGATGSRDEANVSAVGR